MRILVAWLVLAFWFTGPADALRVVVISDLNGRYGSTDYSTTVSNAVSAILQMHPDLVISTGDMVAGQRRPLLTEAQVNEMWAAFHRTITDPLEEAGIPLAVTPGNHDASGYQGFELERRIFEEVWKDHRPNLNFIPGGDYPFHYAFEQGGVAFVSLDATKVGGLDEIQMDWLAALPRDSRKTIVFSHLPLFPIAVDRENEILGDLELADLFNRMGVDLHLSGHHHAFYPGARDEIAYIGQACLGGGGRALIGTDVPSPHSFTVLDIEGGEVMVSALLAPDYRREVDIRNLPESLSHSGFKLTRLDLVHLEAVSAKGR